MLCVNRLRGAAGVSPVKRLRQPVSLSNHSPRLPLGLDRSVSSMMISHDPLHLNQLSTVSLVKDSALQSPPQRYSHCAKCQIQQPESLIKRYHSTIRSMFRRHNADLPLCKIIPYSPGGGCQRAFSTSAVGRHGHDDQGDGDIRVSFVLRDGAVVETRAREGEIALRNQLGVIKAITIELAIRISLY